MIDPLLYAPLIGSVLLGVGSAFLGTILFLQKRILVSETISHTIYPGALLGLLFAAVLNLEANQEAAFFGALISGWLGFKALQYLQQKGLAKNDSAMCLVLSLFFGFGVLLISLIQNQFPLSASEAQALLFGQAATLPNSVLPIYGAAALILSGFILFRFRAIQMFLFDRNFAAFSGINTKRLEQLIFFLLLVFVVLSIRCVGVVMVAGIVIAPAIAARQWTNYLSSLFVFSAFFGALAGFLGCLLSVSFNLPTGPAIVLTNAFFALFSLLFAPKRGFFFKKARHAVFSLRCMEENLLKGLWKRKGASLKELRRFYGMFSRPLLFVLKKQGWIVRKEETFSLSEEGARRAEAIVRRHRLWELYLTEEFGWRVEKVHASAEEMEHILTPNLEKRLNVHLLNPTQDPHAQPIPKTRSSFNEGI